MNSKQALNRINEISDKWSSINALRARANEFAEQFIPQVYEDGDERPVTQAIYDQLVAFGEQLFKLDPTVAPYGTFIPEYRGPFGTLRFVVSDVLD